MKYAPSYPEYWVLKNMQRKCLNPKHADYSHYGGRGIGICKRWQGKEGFDNFIQDMGFRPTPKHTVERKDNDGNYEPSNCRWATRQEQAMNRRVKSTNKSGYTGVYLRASRDKWVANITIDGKRKYLGHFDTPEEASKYYESAKMTYIKENAILK